MEHANLEEGEPIIKSIPRNDIFYVKRCPPDDQRSGGLPISLIVDFIK